MIEDFLLQVLKPARYIGQEWNVSRKDFLTAEVKFALCFADLYEIGMSNLGMRIIYGLLNNIEGVCCERFFSPAHDMEAVLRNQNLEILSLESGKTLREFDFIGFSLGSELGYTNVLNILDLGKIPLEASSRDHVYPLVVGGGPCALNPEPLHEFFDFFVIGEAEEVMPEIVDVYQKFKGTFKSGQISKADLLLKFSHIEGIYVPSFYEVRYSQEGGIEEFMPKAAGITPRVKKRFIKDLDNAYFPLEWLVPYIQIIHDRVTLEIMRGCPNHCRFCQARTLYFPFRKRRQEKIIGYAKQLYRCTGYEEISLIGLSVSDYPGIEELSQALIDSFREKGIGISLPSIKPKPLVGNLASLISTIKKTSLTFAPEVASQKLRKVINKDFDEDDFFKVLEQAYASGYQHIKLYFMIGLPFETEEDLDKIIELAEKASQVRRKVSRQPAQVNITISTLIPKPHTPFQWLKMEDQDKIKHKQEYLKAKVRNKRLKLNFHNLKMSFLEGIFSRGDRRLSRVLLSAFRKGARFDAWEDYFDWQKWEEAFREAGIDPEFYLKEKAKDEFLAWDFLDVNISRDVLLDDFNKIIA